MTKVYMVTMPRQGYSGFTAIMRFFRKFDCHKWIVSAELGAMGYQHWQIRFRCALEPEQAMIAWRLNVCNGFNILEANDNGWEYEGKEGKFLASWDAPGARRVRFGKMEWRQEVAVERARDTNDRQVVVWYDPRGNSGKSWLVGHLVETKQAYYVPPYLATVESMIKTLASMVKADREAGSPPRPLVVIDIPRSYKWKQEMYVAIEAIKDGVIVDPRYSATVENIRGIGVIVMTNERPKLDKLSMDRWDIMEL